MEFARRGAAPADAGDDGRRRPHDPSSPPHAHNFGNGDTFPATMEALRREILKESILQEIIASELAERRELEAEVRRELAMERALLLGCPAGPQLVPLPYHGMAPGLQGGCLSVPTATVLEPSVEGALTSARVPVCVGVQRGWPAMTKPPGFNLEVTPREHCADVNVENVAQLPNIGGNYQRIAEYSKSGWSVRDRIDEWYRFPWQDRPVHEKRASFDEQKLLGFNGVTLPKETSSGVKRKRTTENSLANNQKLFGKWSCALCQVHTTSELSLEEHCAGRRHQSNVAALESSNKTTRPKKKARAELFPGIQQKPTTWDCSICLAKCTCESDLENHLRGRRHQENIEALRREGKTAKVNGEFQGASMCEKNTPQLAKNQNPASVWLCSICQAYCTSELDLQNHLKGRRHQGNIEAICAEGKNAEGKGEFQEAKVCEMNVPQSAGKNWKTVSRWHCSICQANCTSESDLENHLRGRRHQENVESLQREGKNEEANGGFQEAKLEEKNASIHPQKGLKDKATPTGAELGIAKSATIAVDQKFNLVTLPKEMSSGVKRKRTTETSLANNQKLFGKWSCALCQVHTTSELSLEEHCAGLRHQSNVAALESSNKTTRPKKKARAELFPGIQQKPTTWY